MTWNLTPICSDFGQIFLNFINNEIITIEITSVLKKNDCLSEKEKERSHNHIHFNNIHAQTQLLIFQDGSWMTSSSTMLSKS